MGTTLLPVEDGGMQRIVVGVDGSASAQAALRWAMDEARRRRAVVDAVHAWSYPPLSSFPGLVPPPTFARDELADHAKAILDEACDAVDEGHVLLNRIVEEGSAVRCLLDAAEGADLLVVGSRGRGGFAGLLLGSVGQQCASHAPSTVVIVR